MALTQIADLWVPDVWAEGIVERMATLPSLINSGAVANSEEFNDYASGAGLSVNLPMWDDPTDEDDEIQVEDGALGTAKLTTGTQIAPIMNRGKGWAGTTLSAATSGTEPVDFAASKIGMTRLKQRQKTLKSMLDGLFNSGGPLVDFTDNNASESIAGQTSANTIDTAMIINATVALGELEDDLENGAMFVHPTVLGALRLQDENNFERDSSGPFTIVRWKGIPIFKSNLLVRAGTTDGLVYQTYFLASGVFARGEKPQIAGGEELAGSRDAVSSLLQAGDVAKNNWSLYDRTRFLLHPKGMKFTGTPAGQSATNAELATPGNWASVLTSNDRAGMVRIESNG